MLLTGLLVLGTKESARFNVIITVAHLVLVVFIIIAGKEAGSLSLAEWARSVVVLKGFEHGKRFRVTFPHELCW
jgi:hypothetical protein